MTYVTRRIAVNEWRFERDQNVSTESKINRILTETDLDQLSSNKYCRIEIFPKTVHLYLILLLAEGPKDVLNEVNRIAGEKNANDAVPPVLQDHGILHALNEPQSWISIFYSKVELTRFYDDYVTTLHFNLHPKTVIR